MQRTTFPPLNAGPAKRFSRHGLPVIALLFLSLLISAQVWASPSEEADGKSVFLLATDNLSGTAFAQTVILMTHFGGRGGTTGLAINRPSTLSLREAFPKITRLRNSVDSLFLGGPVGTRQVFVLLRTQQSKKGMMHLIDDIYFVPGQQILSQDIDGERRAYAGYVGWAPGQLQTEIDRGDWQVIRSTPDIIFDADTSGLWQQLSKSWSGNWI